MTPVASEPEWTIVSSPAVKRVVPSGGNERDPRGLRSHTGLTPQGPS